MIYTFSNNNLFNMIKNQIIELRNTPKQTGFQIKRCHSMSFQNLECKQISQNFSEPVKCHTNIGLIKNNLKKNLKRQTQYNKDFKNLSNHYLKPSMAFSKNLFNDSNFLGKRSSFYQTNHNSYYNKRPSVQMNFKMQPHLNLKKINNEFENIFSNVKNKNSTKKSIRLFKKDNFSTCSDMNSIYNESILSNNPLLARKNKNQIICKKNDLGQIQAKQKMNTDLVSYSTVLIPEENKDVIHSKELVLSNSYFGDVPVEIRESRKQEIRNLLTNLENTFEYEKNSTITLKNLLKLDTLQILIKPSIYEQLSFQMKIAFFVWYWIKIVDIKWYKKTFEDFLSGVSIQKIKFISEITKR